MKSAYNNYSRPLLALPLVSVWLCLTGTACGNTQKVHSVTTARLDTSAPAGVKPAFLDAANQVTVYLDQPATGESLAGKVSVTCGPETIAVTHAEAVIDAADKHKGEVVLAGTFQAALGGPVWQTDAAETRMTEYAPGVFQFKATLPQGSYEYKVVRGGSWAENYGVGFKPGGDNLKLVVPADATPVLFQVDFNKKAVQTSLDTPGLTAFSGKPLASGAAPAAAASHVLHLTLARRLTPADIVLPLSLKLGDGTARPIYARDVLSGPEYLYNGSDLGPTYAHAQTTFKVWSPVSSSAALLLYPDASSTTAKRVALKQGPNGTWAATVPGDLNGTFYQYQFTSYGAQHTAPDIYGRAASEDLSRSEVVDLARTNPANWNTVPAPKLAAPTDAVVYELHTRDFTVDPSSGVPDALRGKYLGIAAPGTHVPNSQQPTGLEYLKQLGVTHVHVMPFQSIAPSPTPGYNWGYETDLFNVPEPRYGTTPSDSPGVIRDVKTMVTGLHQAHLGLVMDVVYNHSVPSGGDASPFDATVPYYYFRTDPSGNLINESGVGNAVDDDHPMVRKFICDSLAYWETQYHVDGFRFDLLAMFTPQTVTAISQTLHKLRPDILLYGEPWTGGGPTRFGKGSQKGLGVGVFNDNIRTVIRGDLDGTQPGFALGGGADPAKLQAAISGSPDFAQAPTEAMNYVSIHDNETLLDKITQTLPNADALDKQALKLSGAMVLLSQGVPVFEGGAEMGRTKNGSNNSYNLGDPINHFDWSRGARFADVSSYYAGLIALRRAHPAFRCSTAALVKQTLSFLPESSLPAKTSAFTLKGGPTGDIWRQTLVIFHGSADAGVMTLPPGAWHLAASGDKAGATGPAVSGPTLPLAPLSSYVLYQ